MRVLRNLGTFFSERRRTIEAVENLESALEQAKSVYRGKPDITHAAILYELGLTLVKDTQPNLENSLLCFHEAKKVMDQILGPNGAHHTTVLILNGMGINYFHRREFAEALQCFQDAYNMNCEIYDGKNSINDTMGEPCSNTRATEEMGNFISNIAKTAQGMGNFSLAKEYYTKAVKIYRTNRCLAGVVTNLHFLSRICEALGEQDEALKLLEEANEIAKDAGFNGWTVVDILVSLMKKYAEVGCMDKSIRCYIEAGHIAAPHLAAGHLATAEHRSKCLPEDDTLSPSTLEMLKLM
jgi:tetratricopeptide (TPR) repeat protein